LGIPQQILDKLFSLKEAISQVKKWKDLNDRLIFTNGVFDLLHPGHITYLTNAAALGDQLIIGLNADASVKRLGKGDDRPINNEETRAIMLAALSSTSMIVIFNEDTPLSLIENLRPNVLVKGGDYSTEAENGDPKYIVGSDEMKSWNGETKCIPFLPNHSSTAIINKIKRGHGKD
jgi:rfaE bifunctional protein nucleotidyltransferase chain/domain